MKMKVTSPEVTFKPVAVELTFESLEELLVLKHAIGISTGQSIHDSITRDEDNLPNLDKHRCGNISYVQYKFLDGLYQKLKN